MRARYRNEDGAMVILTICLVALLGLAGLVVDGGRGYADHRQVQNAVDAAALAGAGALNTIIGNSVGQEQEVHEAVAASIAAHGTNAGFTCRLIDDHKNDLGPCPTTNTGSGLAPGTAGVSVAAQDTQPTTFMRVLGIDTFSAAATAKAQVQALRGAATPFMICGRGSADGGQDPPLLVYDASQNPPWVVNYGQVPGTPSALGATYHLHGPQVPDCGGGSNSFKGLADDSQTFALPGWWQTKTGDRAGPVRQALAGASACTGGIADGCTLIVPLCDQSNGGTGSSFQMHCDRMGAFRIVNSSANSHDGVFLGNAVVTGGQGGGRPLPGEVRMIKLTE